MERAGVKPRIMIDCSHANSNKDYRRQTLVCHDVAAQIAAGDRRIIGVMIESNLVAGAQKLAGQSRELPRLRPEHHRRLHRLARNLRPPPGTSPAVRSRRKS